MDAKERAKALLYGCKRTEEKEVTINISHACEVLGVDKVEKLALKTHSLRTKYKVRRTARNVNVGLATFNRIELIDAIESSGLLNADDTAYVPRKRFAAGRTRTSSTLIRDRWEGS